jgi:hypothetical protein
VFGHSVLLAVALLQIKEPLQQPSISFTAGCSARPDEVTLTIHNLTDTDTAVLLGYALANGRRYLPRELTVEIKRNRNSEFEPLVYNGPSNVAGRMDHWIVTLPANASFILPLRASDFGANTAGFTPLTAPPEELRIRVTGKVIAADLSLDMAGMKLWHLWEGTAVSNSLRVVADCVR